MAAEARQKQEFQELNKEQTYYRVVQAVVNSAQQGLAEIKDNLLTRGATYFVGGLFVLTGQNVGRAAPWVSPPLYQSDRGDPDAGGNHGADSGLVRKSTRQPR